MTYLIMSLGELPLNTIVIIAIAAVVLISVFGIFGSQFFSSSKSTDTQRLFARGCNALQNTYSCDSTKISDITLDNTKFNSVCSRSGYTEEQCAKACGCVQSNYQDYSV